TGRVGPRWGTARTLRIAQLVVLAAGITLLVLALADGLTMASYLPLVCVYNIGCGAVMSSGAAAALGHAQNTAGAASALLGFTQFVLGALSSPVGGLLGTSTAVPATAAMTGFTVLGIACAVFAGLRERQAAR